MREWCFPGLHTFGTFLTGYSLLEEGCLFCVLGQIKVWVWRFICTFSSRNLILEVSLLFTGLWFSLFPVILSVFPPWPEEANKVMLYFQLSIYWSYLAECVMCVSVVVMNNNICLSPPLEVCGFLYKITNGTKLDPKPHVLQVWSCGPGLTSPASRISWCTVSHHSSGFTTFTLLPEHCDEHQAHLPLVHYPMITYWNCFSASLSPQLMVHLCPV